MEKIVFSFRELKRDATKKSFCQMPSNRAPNIKRKIYLKNNKGRNMIFIKQ